MCRRLRPTAQGCTRLWYVPLLTQTNDQSIVALCTDLRASHPRVFFLSNDTNARMLAEIEGVYTLDLLAMVRALRRFEEPDKHLFWVCATPEFHYVFDDPTILETLPEQVWGRMYAHASQFLPTPIEDVAMLG